MSSSITYEANLRWQRYIEIPPKVMERLVDEINSFRPVVPIEYSFAIIEFTVLHEDGFYIDAKVAIDKESVLGEESIEVIGSILDEVVIGRLKDVFFTINLAYPGHVFIHSSAIYRDGEYVGEVSYSNDVSGSAFEDCKWLPFENLTIKQCWDWITSRTSFLSYISRTPIDRALHALSYESVANEDMYVFYALMGIESIYNDGSNREDSISAQLKRKLQAIIGELPPLAIKEINKMYSRRSQLVHGGANIFKCWPSEDYSEKEYDKTEEERDYMVVATGILLATIQKFIKSNANQLVESISVELC